MIIVGLDPSINSTGCVKFFLDKEFKIIKKEFLGFTTVKKNVKKFEDGEIKFYSKKLFKNDIDKFLWMENEIIEFCKDANFVSIEDYAFGGMGKVFNMAECIGGFKRAIYLKNIPLRKYDIASIKLYATGRGNADKSLMLVNFMKLNENERFIFPSDKIHKSPYEDIIDAFYIAKLLQLEIQLRHAIIPLSSLSLEHIKIFNRTTKGNPVNILARDFIQKNN